MHAVLYEDRLENLIGVKLALLSIERHHPEWTASVFLPRVQDDFSRWCSRLRLASVNVRDDIKKGGWNVKPDCLLTALAAGHKMVIWFDTDLILTRNCNYIFDSVPYGDLIATEEVWWMKNQGSRLRTIGWGLNPGNDIGKTVNSCFMRVDHNHIPLLQAWGALSKTPEYLRAQAAAWEHRPLHMRGGQDILTALLGSSMFSNIPVRLLKNGSEIAHCFEADGYSALDRLKNVFRGLPPLLHAQGMKPWTQKCNCLPTSIELSTYTNGAAMFADALDSEISWIRPKRPIARILNAISFGDPHLRGLLPAVFKSASRHKHRPQNSK